MIWDCLSKLEVDMSRSHGMGGSYRIDTPFIFVFFGGGF